MEGCKMKKIGLYIGLMLCVCSLELQADVLVKVLSTPPLAQVQFNSVLSSPPKVQVPAVLNKQVVSPRIGQVSGGVQVPMVRVNGTTVGGGAPLHVVSAMGLRGANVSGGGGFGGSVSGGMRGSGGSAGSASAGGSVGLLGQRGYVNTRTTISNLSMALYTEDEQTGGGTITPPFPPAAINDGPMAPLTTTWGDLLLLLGLCVVYGLWRRVEAAGSTGSTVRTGEY